MIHVGFQAKPRTGKPVTIPLQHTIIACITRYGKTTTLKQMKKSLPPEYKVLFIDVKRPRDYEGLGFEVPIYLEDRTEPVGLKNLLEASGKMGLKFEFSELIKICKQLAAEDEEGKYGFQDIYSGITRALEQKMHPIRESKLLVLQHLLGRLVKDLDKIEIATELKLPDRYNVMNLSGQRRMLQHIAVYSTIKWILEKLDHVIIVLDELPDFAPQGHGTPAKDIIIEAVRKGGASENWMWLAGQTITGVDKEVLKECNYWILGRQREKNEAQRVLDQVPFKIPGGLNYRDIMKLRVGHAIVVSEENAYVTYVQHPNIDEETARKVSLGELSVNEVIGMLKKGKEDDDLVYKEKYEEEKRKRLELEKEFSRQVERISDLKAKEKILELTKELEAAGDQIAGMNKEMLKLEQRVKNVGEGNKVLVDEVERLSFEVKDLKEKGGGAEELRKAFTKFLRLDEKVVRPPGFEPGSQTVELQPTQTILVTEPDIKHVKVSDSTIRGKILSLAKTGFFGKWQGLGDVHKGLIEKFGWTISKAFLDVELGRMVKDFLLGVKKHPSRKQKVYRLSANIKFVEAQ